MSAGPLQEVFGNLPVGDTVALRGSDELRAGTTVAPPGSAESAGTV